MAAETNGDLSFLPGESQSALCKRCYLRYGDQKSPHCEHVFCVNCFDKSVDAATDEFECFACKHKSSSDTEEGETTPVKADKPRIDDRHEQLAVGVKAVRSIRCNRFKDPQRVGVTGAGDFVVVDTAMQEILTFSSDGDLKKHFPYLVGYSFTGALFVTPNDDLLLSLKNDKYNSVSFYSADGTFAFSAFLSENADVTGVARREDTKEILALDNGNGEICVINTEKSIHQQKQLKASGHEEMPRILSLSSIAISTRGDIIIHDNVNHSVLVFDDKYNFRYAFDTIVEAEDNEKSTAKECGKIAVDRNNCIFTTARNNNGVAVFSLTGELVDTVVTYDHMAGAIQDLVCFGQDKMAVLLTGASAKRGEIRVYSYNIPGRYRNRDDAQCCTIA